MSSMRHAQMMGLEVKYWREYRGLSRAELGQLAELSPTTIGRIERADTATAASDLMKVARALGVSFGDMAERVMYAENMDDRGVAMAGEDQGVDAEPSNVTQGRFGMSDRAPKVERSERAVAKTRRTRHEDQEPGD